MLSLNGTWKAKPDNENTGEDEGYFEIEHDDSDWKPIQVPGHWQEEGFPDHEGILWYRYHFAIPDSMKQFLKIIRLQFSGVFYYCKVWLNEEYLGEHEGYFDVFDFKVTGLLEKQNVLCVKVQCDKDNDMSNKRQITGVFSNWDASDPLFNPGGIWGNVALIETGLTYIKYIEVKPEILNENTAKLYFRFEIVTEKPGEKKFQLVIKPKNFAGSEIQEEFYEKLGKTENEFVKEITIEDAHLWWTWDHGNPDLYLLKFTVFEGEQVSDEKEQLVGIREFTRTIKNRSWEFYLNHKRIYLRGTNYAPCDHRIAYVSKEDYERDVDLLVEGNFNMIRVHAHVDRPELHETCSENGILIWQDFPLQWGYSMKIQESAKVQIKKMAMKLQNYPAQAIYCCHNEPFTGLSPKPILFMIISLLLCYGIAWLVDFYFKVLSNVVFWGLFLLITLAFGFVPTSIMIYNRNKDVLDKHLVEALLEVDESLPVIQNSGIMGMIRKGTDLHTYEGWYMGKDYRDAYCYTRFPLNRMVPFITEYGAQAFPNLESLQKFAANPWPVPWDLLKKAHRCQPMFFAKWFNLSQFTTINELIEATQEYQAELLKFYNELWRINRYKPNGGTLMFQFNDCFPGITWSIIDYWRNPKKGYFATQLSFEPIYVMADWPKKYYKPNHVFKTKIYVVNDLHALISEAQVRWEVVNPGKAVVASGDYKCRLEEDSIQTLGEIQFQIPPDSHGLYELILTLDFKETTIQNRYSLKVK